MFEKIVTVGSRKEVMEYIDLLAMNEREQHAEYCGPDRYDSNGMPSYE